MTLFGSKSNIVVAELVMVLLNASSDKWAEGKRIIVAATARAALTGSFKVSSRHAAAKLKAFYRGRSI